MWRNFAAIDDCSDACKLPTCGDGIVQAGVEGCDDANTADDDGCSADCKNESCGNGTLEGMEQCDDGNLDDTDACTSLCANAICGDSFVQVGVEECDDGNFDDDDGCLSTCAKVWTVFVTSGPNITGDIKGLLGAEYECRHRAVKAGLPNGERYLPWLSTSSSQPSASATVTRTAASSHGALACEGTSVAVATAVVIGHVAPGRRGSLFLFGQFLFRIVDHALTSIGVSIARIKAIPMPSYC